MAADPERTSPLTELLRRLDAAAEGAPSPDTVPTGFPSVDRLLGGGLRRGDLAVLGGDVGAGKSALALAIALRGAAAGRAVRLLSGEMRPDRMLERALAIEGRTRVDDMRRGAIDEPARVTLGSAALRLRNGPPQLEPLPAGGLPALLLALRSSLDSELVIVDSLQSLPGGKLPQDEELAAAVRELKAVAMEHDVALIATAHLPRLDRARADARPTLDDFGALGAVKQQADVILALYREEMYRPDASNEGATELHVLKNRNGPTAYVDLYFYKQWLRFEDMLDPEG